MTTELSLTRLMASINALHAQHSGPTADLGLIASFGGDIHGHAERIGLRETLNHVEAAVALVLGYHGADGCAVTILVNGEIATDLLDAEPDPAKWDAPDDGAVCTDIASRDETVDPNMAEVFDPVTGEALGFIDYDELGMAPE